MAHRKLHTVKGTRVKEWTLTKSQFQKLVRETPAVTTKQVTNSYPRSPFRRLRSDWSRMRSRARTVEKFFPVYFCRPKYRLRKNQKNLTPLQWNRFIYAIEALADADTPVPTYEEYVQVHIDAMSPAGHHWGAHGGVNFLTWHQEYLAKLEARLIQINPRVTLPYWNWVEDRAIPAPLNNPADFARWGITRGASFNAGLLATAAN